MENRPKTTADTYRSHLKGFLRYLATAHPSVTLSGVTPFHVRAWLLHEATRGIEAITRSNDLFALRSFYRFLIAEGLSEENPAAAVTLPSPVRPRVEFYSDAEADAIIEWASSQPGLRWQVGRVLLLTLRYTGLRMKELVNLRTEEVDLEARRISLVGKGRKPRVVPIPHLLADVLREYLDELRPSLPKSAYLFANPKGQPEPPRSLWSSGTAQSRGRGRDFGGRGRSALCSPVASQLCHEPRAPGRGHPRRPATDGPFQHRDHQPVLASLGCGPHRGHRPGFSGKLRVRR